MFDVQKFLKQQVGDDSLECSLVDVSSKQPDTRREFLVTNGLGSYMSAGLWGENSRKYHGLLVAALKPPVDRTVMLTHADEEITIGGGAKIQLATNLWRNSVAPEGYKLVSQFSIYPCPTWVYELPQGVLVKQVTMVPGKQQAVVGYTWLPNAGETAKLSVAVMANYRSYHGETRGSEQWQFQQTASRGRLSVRAYDGAQEMVLRFHNGKLREDPCWYWGYHWPRETERGLNDQEDSFRLGFASLEAELKSGESFTMVVELAGLGIDRVDPELATIGDAVRRVWKEQKKLLERAGNPIDPYQRLLVLAAQQFIVHRDSTDGNSVIAGYHWFNDWGRDSMISLPGLTLSSGRFEVARSILNTFARYASEGMLPNNFPDSGATPAYNTSDATFWWAWAVYQYWKATGDLQFIRDQLPHLDSVVEWHKKGTRHRLRLDQTDGLISGGEPGVQLTWMDAKVGDYVVTPRQGKAIEICALWYNFLRVLAELHRQCADAGLAADATASKTKASEYDTMAAQTAKGMAQFWNEEKGCLYDVINDDGTKDASIRPNQLIALSLPYTAFSTEQGKKILAVVDRDLFVPMGMRTLAPSDPAYKGQYGGGKASANQYDRDITYHQGTAWPWLFGPWVDAHLFVEGETPEVAGVLLKRLEPAMQHILADAGLGSISEIFDGDAPHTARGCIAQAWSVAELLRVRTRLLALAGKPQVQMVASR